MQTVMPPATKQTRNIWAPHSDALMSGFLPNAGNAGGAYDGVTYSKTLPFVGRAATLTVGVRDTWTVTGNNAVATNGDAEGGGIKCGVDAAGATCILSTAAGADLVFPRWTILLRFAVPSLAAARSLFSNGTATSGAPGFSIGTAITSGVVQVTYHDGASAKVITMAAVAAGSVNTLIVWGAPGHVPRARLNGGALVEGAGASAAYSLALKNTKTFQLGKSAAGVYSFPIIYCCAIYDWALDTAAQDELFIDAYLPFRPEASSAFTRSTVRPIMGGVGDMDAVGGDALMWQCSGAATMTDLYYFKAVYANAVGDPYLTSPAGSDAFGPAVAATHQNRPMCSYSAVPLDLSAGDAFRWVGLWSSDGTTYYPFPGGSGWGTAK